MYRHFTNCVHYLYTTCTCYFTEMIDSTLDTKISRDVWNIYHFRLNTKLVLCKTTIINPNPLGIFTRKYPESTKIHQFCHTQNAGVLNPSESASVDIGHILNPPKSTTNFLVDFGRFRIPCSHENLYSMLLHRIYQNLTYTVHVTIIHQPTWPSS